jgi:hypothetical protein
MRARFALASISGRLVLMVTIASFLSCTAQPRTVSADSTPQVELNTGNAGPRSLEPLTQQSIVHHYIAAWKSLTEAFDYNATEALNDYFVAAAKDQLTEAVADQRKIGIRSRYLNQQHRLDVVFYAPEGDVVELHDTMRCELQVVDGEKQIHDEPTVLRYVVLMTPGADRWVIRQLQAVPQF